MRRALFVMAALVVGLSSEASAGLIVYEATGADPASITPTRDDFRSAIGGGTSAGPGGSFGGVRREINWDGVPDASSDPNPLPGDFFANRGAILSTPGTGFLVSANPGTATPTLFGFPNDFQTFSAAKLFTAVNSNITDVTFVVPGTNDAATTNAFGVIFTDVEVAGLTKIEIFDAADSLIFSRDALVSGNQGLSFLGVIGDAGERFGRIRITAGLNTIVSNGVLGNPNDDVVVMDDFIYGEPISNAAIPEPSTMILAVLAGVGFVVLRRSSVVKARAKAR